MLNTIPYYIAVLFLVITAITFFFIYKIISNAANATVRKRTTVIMMAVAGWIILQSILSISHVYSSHLDSVPPLLFRFGLLPVLLFFSYLFISKSGRNFIDTLPLAQLTYLHSIRIPVEIGLYLIYIYGAVPELMTFEGGNLDILSGLSAPVIGFLYFKKKSIKPQLLLLWNLICLALLFNIVSRALLSAPFPFQKLAFNQPNVAILYFPFILLPSFMVATVLFCHLAAIRKIILKRL